MKRLAMASACVVTLLAGSGAGAAAAALPPPGPGPGVRPGVSLDADTKLDGNTKQVCEQTGETFEDGITSFIAELDRAGTAATGGDLVGAEKYVKQAGTVLVALASRLRSESVHAQNSQLKAALEAVAKEFDALGSSLTGLTSLQNLNTDRLETLATRVAEICGAN